MNTIKASVVIAAILYLVTSIMSAQFNPTLWDGGVIVFVVIMWLVMSLLALFAANKII